MTLTPQLRKSYLDRQKDKTLTAAQSHYAATVPSKSCERR